MHKYVIFNGDLIPAEEAKLPAISPAALYGQGVFTTLAIYKSRPFLWKEHWTRLMEHANTAFVFFGDEIKEEIILNSLNRLIKVNGIQIGRARITLFSITDKGFNKGMWNLKDIKENVCYFLITTTDAHKQLNSEIIIVPSFWKVFSQSPLAGIKSINYQDRLIALKKNKYDNYDEAMRVNEKGFVVSGCMSNVFWVKDGVLFTPHLKTGLVEGTTRNFIITLAKECSVYVRQTQMKINAMKEADEIFLTSSGIGVCLVKRFDERVFTYTKKSLAHQLREAFKGSTSKF